MEERLFTILQYDGVEKTKDPSQTKAISYGGYT